MSHCRRLLTFGIPSEPTVCPYNILIPTTLTRKTEQVPQKCSYSFPISQPRNITLNNITFCLDKYNKVMKAEVMCICTDFVFMAISSLNVLDKRKDVIRKSSRRIPMSRDEKICHLVLCNILYI
jgi:hypothetical protein